MDTKLIQQFGTDILCYRLRTARQKKRMQYENFDKYLIALSKEESLLYKEKYTPVWEPLEPPVQRGWKRFFVLREDVARGQQAEFFENILKKINTYHWSNRKDFKVRKRKFGRKIYVVATQELKKPTSREFKKLEFTEAEEKFFHIEYHYDLYQKKFLLHYAFNEPWRFVLRVRPNMIDKKRKTDPEKESKLFEIRNYINKNGYRARMHKVVYGRVSYPCKWKKTDWQKQIEKLGFKNMPLGKVLDLTKEEVFSS